MSWYIDAVAELDELHARHCASCNAFSGEDCKQCKIGHIVDFLENKYLDDAQTADVAEVKHAHWVQYEQPYGLGYSIPEYKPTHYCSNCNGLGWEFYGTCPHCSAKMDGGKNK